MGGPVAEHALDVAAGAIRGVAYGVIGTAAIQAVLLAIGILRPSCFYPRVTTVVASKDRMLPPSIVV